MDGGAVCASVVGEQLLDGDPVAGIESERSLEKPDRGGGFLIGENLGVGQASAVVDDDVDVFPADDLAVDTFGV